MLNAEQVIKEVNALHVPNAGIIDLVRYDCCIMDERCEMYPYREDGRCPDYNRCDDASYMLACLSSRNSHQVAQWVVDVYNSAMGYE